MGLKQSNQQIFAAVDRTHELIAEGNSARRAMALVAREEGVGTTTIWRWAQQCGRPFTVEGQSAARTLAASRVHVDIGKERRGQSLARAFEAIDAMWDQVVEPNQLKDLLTALGIAIDKARLESGEVTDRQEQVNRQEIVQQARARLHALRQTG